MTKTLGSLMSSSNYLGINSFFSGATILGVPIETLSGNKLRIDDNVYEFSPEVHKALSSTAFSGKTMKNENDFIRMNVFINGLSYTGVGGKLSKRKTFFTITPPKLDENFQKRTFAENKMIQKVKEWKRYKKSNLFDNYTRLEILLRLKLSGHTDTLREASNLIDELYKIGKIYNEQ